ncbi:bridge-like lipid transfer protein family member 3B isoform X2 [Scleropages formosus]|uniref:Bridge-like lipid transfer protein family member 3B n=1 Tax=Scleropages formosus TaxID=113540 RepID=A0A8C9QUI0_SCLFO|nr:UHRF1-binding protein 1-like isoform X2 [Scleropages formosus]
MAGLIKKQILKHLSRFAKNLSPDKINLSTLKGEGQLTNLELDEEVLQNMLDLPTWLAINKVCCNKAAIRIPWTKLKTHPISLSLDKVVMEMSTCDEPRPPNGPSPIATASGQSEYGFAEKVVEGISLSVNSIVIRISAKAFNASFELSQLQVYSVNTSWVVSDLRFTRIQDPQRGEILTFKEISWQMIRIEADAIQSGDHEMLSAPIRLITNQSKIRVTLKRRMKDCNVVASKLILVLDDLLWVLTDSQLKAMVQYAKSLSESMEKSAQQRKSTASESSQGAAAPPSSQQVRSQQSAASIDQNAAMAKLFNAYDVRETSHHLQITHLDLHICDDVHSKDRVINKQIAGGAMQLSFSQITVDYYPFHRAGESCQHWMHYSDATKARESWVRSLLDEFKANVDMLKNAVKDHQSLGSPPHTSPQHGKISTTSTSAFTPSSQAPKTMLMSSSVVLRMADFSIYQVSTADQRRSSPKTMISCNKKSLYLPQEMPAIHVEFTEYYFPDGKDYPIPCPNLYAQLNALQLVLDPRSLVWLNQFALDLRQSLEQFMELYKLDDSQKPDEHVDIKVDGLMLKLVLPTEQELSGSSDMPGCVSIQTSEMVATNTRHAPGCRRSDLEEVLQDFQVEDFFVHGPTSFPRSTDAFRILHPVFQRHAHERDTRMHDVYRGLIPPSLGADALKAPAAGDLWALRFAQFWADFEGSRSGRGRPVPFVDSFPLTLWVCQPARYARYQEQQQAAASLKTVPHSESVEIADRLHRKRLLKEYYSSEKQSTPNGILPSCPSSSKSSVTDADVQVLVHVQKHLSVQLSHQQYVFLLHLQQSFRDLQQTLQLDHEQMSTHRPDCQDIDLTRPLVCMGLLLRSAEVALLMQPVPQPPDSAPSGNASPLGSDLSPSDSKTTLGTGGGGVADQPTALLATADELLCYGPSEGEEPPRGPTPLQPIKAPSDVEEKNGAAGKSAFLEKQSSGDQLLGQLVGEGGTVDREPLPKAEPPVPRECTDSRDRTNAARLSQSMSSGRLMRDRSQSSFSVSYKNLKKSPSLQSLDNISIDSYLLEEQGLEDCDSYSLLEREGAGDDVSISGFKDTLSDQSGAESANELLGPETTTISPDAVSATSQSIEEHPRDLVSVLVLKMQSLCGVLDMHGKSTAVTLQVGQVAPSQLGNVSVRQYLSNRSLGGGVSSVSSASNKSQPEVQIRLESGPWAAVRSPMAARSGFLQGHLQELSADFLISSLRSLAHFLDDDSTSQVLPMRINICSTRINLQDDSTRDNGGDTESKPIALYIDNLLIHREDDGSFSIGGEPCTPKTPLTPRMYLHCPPPKTSDQPQVVGTERADHVCEGKLTTLPEVLPRVKSVSCSTQTPLWPSEGPPPATTSTNGSKEQLLLEENECLKVALSRAKMALAEAQMEKDSLMHHMKTLKLTAGGSS